MTAFLKMIGSSQNPCPEPYEKTYADFSRIPRQVHKGDHLVLYAVGGQKRVFALAEVTSEVYKPNTDYDERWPYRVNISYSVNLLASDGVHIDDVSTPERDLSRSAWQQSYIRLSPEEYERAATKLQSIKRP